MPAPGFASALIRSSFQLHIDSAPINAGSFNKHKKMHTKVLVFSLSVCRFPPPSPFLQENRIPNETHSRSSMSHTRAGSLNKHTKSSFITDNVCISYLRAPDNHVPNQKVSCAGMLFSVLVCFSPFFCAHKRVLNTFNALKPDRFSVIAQIGGNDVHTRKSGPSRIRTFC